MSTYAICDQIRGIKPSGVCQSDNYFDSNDEKIDVLWWRDFPHISSNLWAHMIPARDSWSASRRKPMMSSICLFVIAPSNVFNDAASGVGLDSFVVGDLSEDCGAAATPSRAAGDAGTTNAGSIVPTLSLLCGKVKSYRRGGEIWVLNVYIVR